MKPLSDPLERDIEGAIVTFAKGKGCYVRKFTSPSQRSVPDRIFITPTGRVFFMELKREGKKSTPAQEIEQDKIRAHGVLVFVVDNVDAGKKIVMDMLTL